MIQERKYFFGRTIETGRNFFRTWSEFSKQQIFNFFTLTTNPFSSTHLNSTSQLSDTTRSYKTQSSQPCHAHIFSRVTDGKKINLAPEMLKFSSDDFFFSNAKRQACIPHTRRAADREVIILNYEATHQIQSNDKTMAKALKWLSISKSQTASKMSKRSEYEVIIY